MNELRIDPSTVLRNCARGTRAHARSPRRHTSARSPPSTFLSSMVTSTRSMSDLAHTVSCERLPQRIAARTERSSFTRATSASSASCEPLLDRPVSHAPPPRPPSRPLARSECMNELWIDPSTVLRNSARGTSPHARSLHRHTVPGLLPPPSCRRRPQAPDRCLTWPTPYRARGCRKGPQPGRSGPSSHTRRASSALVNLSSIGPYPMLHRRGRQLCFPDPISSRRIRPPSYWQPVRPRTNSS